jgi:hypothetical protein
MMPTHTLRHGLALAVGVACLGALVGCGTSASPKASEASVATGQKPGQASSPAGNTAAAANEARPQLRLDSTDEERWALRQTWYQCLRTNGAPVSEVPADKRIPYAKPGDLMPQIQGYLDTDPRFTEPRKKCAAKEPLEPAELDPRRNPKYAAQWDKMMACLRATGGEVTEFKEHDGIHNGYTFNAMEKNIDADAVMRNCQMKAFGSR